MRFETRLEAESSSNHWTCRYASTADRQIESIRELDRPKMSNVLRLIYGESLIRLVTS